MDQLPQPRADWCLFLDFDGTLVELQERPDAVTGTQALIDLLGALSSAFEGAVAIVSGRSIDSLELLLAPLELPLAGLHGLERRDAAGHRYRRKASAAALQPMRAAVARFVAREPGVSWEDKGGALAVHYRDAPAKQEVVRRFLEDQSAALGPQFHVQPGKAVFELKPVDGNKGRAVSAFLATPPFAGRLPVFVGDDVTDEDAFARVNEAGGWSVRVGPPEIAGPEIASVATCHIDSVAATLAWLRTLPGAIGR